MVEFAKTRLTLSPTPAFSCNNVVCLQVNGKLLWETHYFSLGGGAGGCTCAVLPLHPIEKWCACSGVCCSSVTSAARNIASSNSQSLFPRDRIQIDRNIMRSAEEYGELILPWDSRLLLISNSNAILPIGNTLNLTEISSCPDHSLSLFLNHSFNTWLRFFIRES